MELPEGELSVVIVDDIEMAVMNQQYFGRHGPTNVIAFSMREGRFAEVNPQLLGDVIISIETAQQEAADAGIERDERFKQLLVHGILHLLGYDHEKTAPEAQRMEAKSQEVLSLIN